MRAPQFLNLDKNNKKLSASIPLMTEEYTLEFQKMPASKINLPVRQKNVVTFLFSNETLIERQSKQESQMGRFSRGDCGIYPPGYGEEIYWHNGVEALNIHIHQKTISNYGKRLFGTNEINLKRNFRIQDNTLSKLGFDLKKVFFLPSEARKREGNKLMSSFITHLLKNYKSSPSSKTKKQITDHARYNHVLDFISGNLDRPLLTDELASLADMSKFHFSRKFSSFFGVSPYQYVMNQRVVRAKELLSHSGPSLAEVGYACGFNDQSHFTRIFHQFTGQTPKKFRMMLTKGLL